MKLHSIPPIVHRVQIQRPRKRFNAKDFVFRVLLARSRSERSSQENVSADEIDVTQRPSGESPSDQGRWARKSSTSSSEPSKKSSSSPRATTNPPLQVGNQKPTKAEVKPSPVKHLPLPSPQSDIAKASKTAVDSKAVLKKISQQMSTLLQMFARLPRPALAGIGTLALVLTVTLGYVVFAGSNSTPSDGCAKSTRIQVWAPPETQTALEPVFNQTIRVSGHCVTVDPSFIESVQAVQAITESWSTTGVRLWIPDSSMWVERLPEDSYIIDGNLVSSPLVVGTSREAVEDAGWATASPLWREIFQDKREFSLANIDRSTETLLALAAIRTSLNNSVEADSSVVQAYLDAQRGSTPSVETALYESTIGSVDAPALPMTEHDLIKANRTSQNSHLVAVYPKDGTPVLDYPFVRYGNLSSDERDAVAAVVNRLRSLDVLTTLKNDGFRDPDATAVAPIEAAESATSQLGELVVMRQDPRELRTMLARLSTLSKPTKILSVLDASDASRRRASGGRTWFDVGRGASLAALDAFDKKAQVGAWLYSDGGGNGKHYAELAPPRALGDEIDSRGTTHRDFLRQVASAATPRGGKAGLYDTVWSGIETLRADYNGGYSNNIAVIAGGPDTSSELSLDELTERIVQDSREHPNQPIRLIMVGMGPGVDKAALEQLAKAAGEPQAYTANTTEDLIKVMIKALATR